MILCSIQQARVRLLIDEVFLITNQIQTSQSSNFAQVIHFSNRNFNLLNNLLAYHGQLHDRLHATQTVADQQDEQLYNISQARATTSSIPSVVGIRTRLSVHQKYACPALCECDCHKIRSFRSPPLLKNLLGLLFISYSGYPFGFLRRYSETVCQSQPQFRARALYYFPFWLFHRMIDATFIFSHINKPSLSLIIRGTFSAGSDIYQAILTDDDQGARYLLTKDSARPNDIHITQGDNLLYISSKIQMSVQAYFH